MKEKKQKEVKVKKPAKSASCKVRTKVKAGTLFDRS